MKYSACKIFSGCRIIFLLLMFAALYCVTPLGVLPALADFEDEFVDSISGMTFRILAEPSGQTPGEVEVGPSWSMEEHRVIPAEVSTSNHSDSGTAVYRVTSIGPEAFRGSTMLQSIIIPNSVTRIGPGAFSGCYFLAPITLPPNLTTIESSAFYRCASVDGTSITIPSSVTFIGECAFSESGFSKIILQNGIKSISHEMFSGCWGLTEIQLPASITDINISAFRDCWQLDRIIVHPNNQSYSSDQDGILYNHDQSELLFCPTTKKGSFVIPSSVRTIAVKAFSNCKGLTEITFPENVVVIDDWAFNSCDSLTAVRLPNSVISIGESAFGNCSSITDFFIPSGLTELGDWSFSGCRKLIKFTVHPENRYYSSDANGLLYNKNMTVLIRCPEGKKGFVAVPIGVTGLHDGAFFRCREMTGISLPPSVTRIGESALYFCSGLREIIIPAAVSEINGWAFSNCSGLTSIAIPAGVTTIHDEAFSDCVLLEEILVDPNNRYFSSIDGVLYDKKQTRLLFYPEDKKGVLTIPPSVTSINYYRLQQNTSLKKILVDKNNPIFSSVDGVLYNKEQTELLLCPIGISGNISIPAGVAAIDSITFTNRTELTGVTLPASITSIGSGAIASCPNIKYVTFYGRQPLLSYGVFGYDRNITLRVPFGDPSWDNYYDIEGSSILRFDPGSAAPHVVAVNPSDENSDIDGNNDIDGYISITFNKPMHSTQVGTITLSNGIGALPDSAAIWSESGLVYHIPYDSLAFDSEYVLTVSGFSELSGLNMKEDRSFTFRTKLPPAETADPSVFPTELHLYTGGTDRFMVFFGEHTKNVSSASVSVRDASVAAVSSERTYLRTSRTPVPVAGQAAGHTTIDIAFHDVALTTVNTLEVAITVYDPPDSILVNYNANGGTATDRNSNEASLAMKSDKAGFDLLYEVRPNPFTRQNHRFLGWSTTANGADGVFYAAGSIIAGLKREITFYAQWESVAPVWNDGNGGGGNGGGSGGGNSGGGSISGAAVTQAGSTSGPGQNWTVTIDTRQNDPVTARITVTGIPDEHAALHLTITDAMLSEAIEKAVTAANRLYGSSENGLVVEIQLIADDSAAKPIVSGDVKSLRIDITDSAIRQLIGVPARLSVRSSIFRFLLDEQAVTELGKRASGGFISIAVSPVPANILSDAAAHAIGARLVYDFSVLDSKGKNVLRYGTGKITRGIPYQPANGEKAENLFIVKTAGKGIRWIEESFYENGWMNWDGDSNSTYGIGYKANESDAALFTDVSGHWALTDIDYVLTNGIIAGITETTFEPETDIIRSHFIMALVKSGGVDVDGFGIDNIGSFTDVSGNDPALAYIEWAVAHKVVQGVGGGRFAPEDKITREQMAVMMVNFTKAVAGNLPGSAEPILFIDAGNISDWACEAVQAVQLAGIINGKPDAALSDGGSGLRFDPKGNATRAESAAIIHRFSILHISLQTCPQAASAR